MELDPVSTSIKADAGWFYYQARRFEDAVELCEVTRELDPANTNALWCLLQSRRLAGREAQALELFEQAYQGHSSCVLSLAADPQLDALRGDPRFDDLLARLGLPG